MRRLLLALLLCAACKHASSSSSTSHSETSTTTDTTSSESGATTTTTTVTEAPGETTTTTEEFGPLAQESNSASDDAIPEDANTGSQGAEQQDPQATHSPTVPRHGPLVKRTVTVTKSGGETTQTRSEASTQAQGATETRETGKVDAKAQEATSSKPALSCAFGGWLVTLVVGVAILGIIYGALKLRKVI
jgi:hypothetical protein